MWPNNQPTNQPTDQPTDRTESRDAIAYKTRPIGLIDAIELEFYSP